jgi:hypothetical protein
MGDLTEKNSASNTKLVGSDLSGSESNFVGATSTGELKTHDVVKNQLVHSVVSVTTTRSEAKVGASKLTDRKFLFIKNLGNPTVFWGGSGVTTSGATMGDSLAKDESITLALDVPVYLIATGTADVLIMEGN